MYSRYRCRSECPTYTPRPLKSNCCPPPVVNPRVPATPESIRIQARVGACTPYIQPTASSNPCLSGDTTVRQPTTTHEPVLVRTVASSETTRLRTIQSVQEEQFSFDPERRFQQFFPKRPLAPERILCPERIPNKEPVFSLVASRCIPSVRFRPSVEPGEEAPAM